MRVYSGWRIDVGTGPGGMSKNAAVALFSVFGVGLFLMMFGQWRLTLGLIVVMAVGVAISVPLHGVPLAWYMGREIRSLFWRRNSRIYTSGIADDKALGPDDMPELPGVLAPTRLIEVEGGIGQGAPWAAIYNPAEETISLTVLLDPPAATMVSRETYERLVESWGDFMRYVAVVPALSHIAVSITTRPGASIVGGDDLRGLIKTDAPAISQDLVNELADNESRYSPDVDFALEVTFLTNKGDLQDKIASVGRQIQTLLRSLSDVGISAMRIAQSTDLVQRVRTVYDPDSQLGDCDSWRDAGPISAEERRKFAIVGDFLVRSWVMRRMPTNPVDATILAGLVEPSPWAKRVTLIWRPMSHAQAAQYAEAARKPNMLAMFTDRFRETTAADHVRAEKIEQMAYEQATGQGLGVMHLYVSAWVEHYGELDDMTADIEGRARQASILLRQASNMHSANAAIGCGAGLYPAKAKV